MEYYNVETVRENVLLVKAKNEGKFPYSHSILILDDEIVLIDTGCGIEILKQLKREYNINCVINSHTHPDHSAGNWVFRNKPIYVPEEGFNTSGNLDALSKRFMSEELRQVWQEFVKKQMRFGPCKPTDSYGRRTLFNFGDTILEPIYTPGHTKDHYCFFDRKKKILFSFDYDLTSFPWYGHRESSIPEFRESVRELKALSSKIVVSSHKGIITENINAEFDRYCRIIDERDEKILSLLNRGKTIDQLVEYAPFYGKFPYAEPLLRYWERQMIKKHLEQLTIQGRIKKTSMSTYHRHSCRNSVFRPVQHP